MRHTLKISYTCYIKNPSRPSARYYARVRENGKVRDIDLSTKSKPVAEAWVSLRRDELERFNQYVLCGEEPPEDLEKKLVRACYSFQQRGASGAPVKLLIAIDGFELELRRKGLRERTVAAYVRNVRQIVPAGATVADFTRDNVLKWLAVYDGLKSATRKFYSVSMRELAKYLVNDYDIDPRILNNWTTVKVESAEKGYWRMNEMKAIIEAIDCRNPIIKEQMQVYCWIMATCGSRQGETYLLRWSDFKDGNLTFRSENTKNHRTRTIPLDMRVVDMLVRLRKHREGETIFDALPRTQAGRYSMLAKAIKRSGMPAGNLHSFRHSCSMLLYSKTSDLKAICQYLGHDPSTALRYYQASRQPQELRRMVDEAYQDENLIPSKVDAMIKDGLI